MNTKLLTFLFIVLGSLLVALLSNFIFRGAYAHLIVILFLNVFLALPLAFLALVAGLLYFFLSRNWLLWIATVSLAVSVSLFLQVPFQVLGENLLHEDIASAKAYCESLVPLLDAHKSATGSYPASLDKLSPPIPRPLPRLLRNRNFYLTSPDGFAFHFEVEDRLMFTSTYLYTSGDHDWQELGGR